MTIFRRIDKVKNVGKGWESNPFLSLENPVVQPLCHGNNWNFWQMSAKSWKFMARQRFEPEPTAWEMFVLTPLLKSIFE